MLRPMCVADGLKKQQGPSSTEGSKDELICGCKAADDMPYNARKMPPFKCVAPRQDTEAKQPVMQNPEHSPAGERNNSTSARP